MATDLARWQDLIRERFVALDIRSPDRDPDLHGRIGRTHTVGPLAVATVRSGSQTFRRTPRLISHYGEDVVQVGHVRRGTALLEQDGRSCQLGQGRFAVYDTTRPFTWTMRGQWTLDVLTWPRTALALDEAQAHAVTARGLGTGPTAEVARAAMRRLARLGCDGDRGHRADLGGTEGVVLASHIAELVLGAASYAEPVRDSTFRVETVLGFIELHLRDPLLSPAFVAAQFHLSVRSLQRLFAGQPRGVAEWIRYRRLVSARGELAAGPHRPVAVVAARYCFATPTTFARAFRDEFGCSPRDVRHGTVAQRR